MSKKSSTFASELENGVITNKKTTRKNMENNMVTWKSWEQRIFNYELAQKECQYYLSLREWIMIVLDKEYTDYIKERGLKVQANDVEGFLEFVEDYCLKDMSTSDLLKIGHGSRFKGMAEEYIVNYVARAICNENAEIDKYISAEPQLCEDEYWDEYNWAWDTIYRGCGFEDVTNSLPSSLDINEVDLVMRYFADSEKIIENVKKEFGEKYFPTEKDFEFVIENPSKYVVKAKTFYEAKEQLNKYLKYGWFRGCQVKQLI